MLHLRKCILSHLLFPPAPCTPSTTRTFPLHRLLSATATPFNVEDYLVATCHLTPAKALKASKALSHLKSPSKPDAVLAFLSGLGLSDADIAAAVANDPKLLCSRVQRTLAPRLAELQNYGLSPSEIARFVLVAPEKFRSRTVVSKLQYYVPVFGSVDNLLRALRTNTYLLSSDLDRAVKPNVAFLMEECGLGACDIAKLCRARPRLLTTNPQCVRAMVELAETVGMPRGTRMFRHSLAAVGFLSKEKITTKVEFLKKTFGWSHAVVGVVVSKFPAVLRYSKDRLHCMSEFLITQVGLEPEDVARGPDLLSYSLERRLMPRHYVFKFLKENGLLERNKSYYSAIKLSENVFVEKFIHPYKEAAPTLAQDYAVACRGEVPPTFRSQELGTGSESV